MMKSLIFTHKHKTLFFVSIFHIMKVSWIEGRRGQGVVWKDKMKKNRAYMQILYQATYIQYIHKSLYSWYLEQE